MLRVRVCDENSSSRSNQGDCSKSDDDTRNRSDADWNVAILKIISEEKLWKC